MASLDTQESFARLRALMVEMLTERGIDKATAEKAAEAANPRYSLTAIKGMAPGPVLFQFECDYDACMAVLITAGISGDYLDGMARENTHNKGNEQ